MPISAEVIAAIISALGSAGSAAISKKTDAPSDSASILDWTYPGDDHSQRPSYNEGGTAYQFMSSHFKKPSPDVPEDRKVYDENGRLLGWFDNAGPAKSGFAGKGFTSKRDAFIHAQQSPYQMNRGTEGEMWMGQRENIFRQDLDFANREAANSLSIRKHQFDDNLLMDRKKARWDYSTMNQLRGENLADTQMLQERHWSWQQAHAGEEGQAFRARMQAQYPGASTWDLLSGGTASGAGPGAVPGLPGMPPPSAGTARSGPDPAALSAKLAANSSMMQTMVNAKLQQQQMAMQEGIAKRTALIQFMNTAIAGAKTPTDIMARAAAAKLATKQGVTEDFRPGLLHEQASEAASGASRNDAQAALADAQRAKTLIESRNAKFGRKFEQWRNVAKEPGLRDMLQLMLGDNAGKLYELFRSSSIR